ncbi:hypothetical protein B0H14DRAFT_1443858 [Mycena olivaceomarginata]|nr:hypothetical protein B0H14DRAFT_1443858 [Mycena olivaceomarginata]
MGLMVRLHLLLNLLKLSLFCSARVDSKCVDLNLLALSATLCNSSPHLRLRTRTSYTVSTQERRKMHTLHICTVAGRAASSALHASCRRCTRPATAICHVTQRRRRLLRADSRRMLELHTESCICALGLYPPSPPTALSARVVMRRTQPARPRRGTGTSCESLSACLHIVPAYCELVLVLCSSDASWRAARELCTLVSTTQIAPPRAVERWMCAMSSSSVPHSSSQPARPRRHACARCAPASRGWAP